MKNVILFLFTLFFINFTHADWKSIGPFGGSVTCFLNIGNDVLAGTSSGGIFLSSDHGVSWQLVNIGITDPQISCMIMAGSSIYAGHQYGELSKSIDNGRSWTDIQCYPGGINAMATLGKKIFLAIRNGRGIYVSNDDGDNWAATNQGLSDLYVNVLAVSGSTLFAGTNQSGVFISADSGKTWTQSNAGFTDNVIQALYVSGSAIYACTKNKGIFCSVDDGLHWNSMSNGLGGLNVNSFASHGTTLYAGTLSGMYISIDEGNNWTYNLWDCITAITFSGGNVLAGSSTRGVYLSSDSGDSWTLSNKGLAAVGIVNLTFIGSELYASSGGLWIEKSTDNGQNWTSLNKGLNCSSIGYVYAIDSTLFADVIGLFKSTDHGENWHLVSNEFTRFNSMRKIIESNSSLYMATASVYQSDDNGDNWTKKSNNAWKDSVIWDFAACGTNLFVASSDGLHESFDKGENWTTVGGGLPPEVPIYVLGVNGASVFASSGSNVFFSADSGKSWKVIRNQPVSSLAFDGSVVYASLLYGSVLMTLDNGENWIDITDVLSCEIIQGLIIHSNYIYAATNGGGIWNRPLSELFAVKEITSTNEFSILPNPMSSSSVIQLSNELKNGELIILDILGKEQLRKKVEGTQLEIARENLKSGVYIVKISDNKNMYIKKMIVD